MSEKTIDHLNADGENEVRQALDLLVPPLQLDDRRNWEKALSDAGVETTRTRLPRLVLPRGRRLRIAILVAIVAIAILIPALAIGSGLWSSEGPPVPPLGRPMTPVVSIASGFGNGQKWQLSAYMTQRLGMCAGIAQTGNFCGAGVIGEPAELYPSDKAPSHELSGGVMMSGGFADALGLAAKDVRSVSLRLLSGAELPAIVVAAPARLGADVSIYYRILKPAEAEQVNGLIARAADGSVIRQLTFKPIQAPQAQPLQGIRVASGTRADGPWELGAYVSKRSQLFLDLITADGSKDTYSENTKGAPIDVDANGREYDASFSYTLDSPGAAAGGVVYGAATKRVDSIAIVLQSGAEIPATIVPAPPKLGLDSSIFTVVFSPAQALELKSVVARAADGTVLQTDQLDPLPATTPPAPSPPAP